MYEDSHLESAYEDRYQYDEAREVDYEEVYGDAFCLFCGEYDNTGNGVCSMCEEEYYDG